MSNATPGPRSFASSKARKLLPLRMRNHELLRKRFDTLLRLPETKITPRTRLLRVRRLILNEGLPDETPEESSGEVVERGLCTLRGRVYKLLLRMKADEVNAQEYIDLIERGPSLSAEQIGFDIPRTCPEPGFYNRVSKDKMTRLLNAFVHSVGGSYVQGMNQLCAPFLFEMPEVEAFFCYRKFITGQLPRYVQSGVKTGFAGVLDGLELLDAVIETLDPELHRFLMSKKLVTSKMYAFPAVCTLMAIYKPFSEVLRLWDFLLAFGVHLNVLAAASQFILLREQIMSAKDLSTFLTVRSMPPIDSELIISVMTRLVLQLPDSLYEQLVRHPLHPIRPS
eukprot:GILK01006059.1.p1 GENE.GILK01006059.1~~GILK01006059.1.p1  ORF type:complete len:373 (-),score=43.19 GILK01006059.1:160-1173(-)